MKKHGHYCKVCGEYKANEKFSGKGHASHICKSCASLPAETQAELMTLNRLLNLPWRLSKEQLSWLKNRLKDRRPDVRALAQEDVYKRQIPKCTALWAISLDASRITEEMELDTKVTFLIP